MAAGLSIFLADNSNIHFCALTRKPVWNWKVAVSQGRECLQAQRCYTMSGLVDAKSLGFRAKRRSAGSKNNVIAVIGQPKPGVFTRCRDSESESLVIRSQSAPPHVRPWTGGRMCFLPVSCDPSGQLLWSLRFTRALLSPTHLHCLLPGSCSQVCYLCMECPAKLPGASLLQPARLTWQTLAALSCWAALDFRENKQFCGWVQVSSQISTQIRRECPFHFHSSQKLPHTVIIQSLCNCCAVFHCPLSCLLAC